VANSFNIRSCNRYCLSRYEFIYHK